jgi:hypothetical protein
MGTGAAGAVDLGGGAGAGLAGAVATRLVAHAERRKSAPTIRPSRTLCLSGMAQHTRELPAVDAFPNA